MEFRRGFFLLVVGGLFLLGCGSTDPDPISIIFPGNGSTVSGFITIKVETSGNVTEVHFYIDGSEYGSDNGTPYEFEWDTRHETNGSYRIKAEADYSSGEKRATEITVTVQN